MDNRVIFFTHFSHCHLVMIFFIFSTCTETFILMFPCWLIYSPRAICPLYLLGIIFFLLYRDLLLIMFGLKQFSLLGSLSPHFSARRRKFTHLTINHLRGCWAINVFFMDRQTENRNKPLGSVSLTCFNSPASSSDPGFWSKQIPPSAEITSSSQFPRASALLCQQRNAGCCGWLLCC